MFVVRLVKFFHSCLKSHKKICMNEKKNESYNLDPFRQRQTWIGGDDLEGSGV